MKYLKSGIVVSVALSLLLLGCSEEKSSEAQKKVESTVEKSVEALEEKTEAIEEEVEEKVELIEEKAEVLEEKVEQKVEAVQEEVEVVKEEVVAVVEQKSGADIYKTCASCHGQKAEKPAMGKSQVIQGWDVDKTVAALQGYKDGSYGGAMKTLMKGQAGKLSDEDMKQVAEYISKL